MIAPLFRVDKPHFHTNSGSLANGWKLCSYLSGTDIPVQLYKDPEGKEKYPTEIVLNNRGEPDGMGIFAEATLAYKVVLRTQLNAPVYCIDKLTVGGVLPQPLPGNILVYVESIDAGIDVAARTDDEGNVHYNISFSKIFGEMLQGLQDRAAMTLVYDVTGGSNTEVTVVGQTPHGDRILRIDSVKSTTETDSHHLYYEHRDSSRNNEVVVVKMQQESEKALDEIVDGTLLSKAKTEIRQGKNVVVTKDTAGDGHDIYTINSTGGGGGGESYNSGKGIVIDDSNDVNVFAGNGLEFDAKNRLQVKLGKGLKFDNESGIEGEISIDDVGQEVIKEVQELANDLDKKITTTFNYAQIKSMRDFAPFGVVGTTRLIGQIFAVPIATEIRLEETLISVRALQNYSGNVSFGIFEFDFAGNEGTGSTTWVCDTGVVSVRAGENQFPVKHMKSTSVTEPVIKMVPGKLYYATVLIAGDAPATGLYLAADEPYEANYNATPKYTMIASNMDGYVNWNIGSQEGTWFQGYNEFCEVPRLFMMIRNGEIAPVPIVDPFRNYVSFSLESSYKISDVFSLSLVPTNYPVMYQKIIPQEDVAISKIGWCTTQSTPIYAFGGDIPIILDNAYTGLVNFERCDETADVLIDDSHYYSEFQLPEPLLLAKGAIYWVPAFVNIVNGVDELLVTYTTPRDTTKDLVLFQSKWNINQWAIMGGYAEYRNAQPAPLCRITTSQNKVYTF